MNQQICSLGEGLFADSVGGLWWVDIPNRQLLWSAGGDLKIFELPEMASKVLAVFETRVTLACESGVGLFDTVQDRWELVCQAPALSWDGTGRANDASLLPDKTLLVGRMDFNPSPMTGDVVHYGSGAPKIMLKGIAIPNTFVCLPSEQGILISDSLSKKTYCYAIPVEPYEQRQPKLWYDFSDYSGTPDGGVLASDGFVYIAIWGMGIVMKFTVGGRLLKKIPVGALQPTSIQEHDDKNLYVTSATVGMSKRDMRRYPSSGSLLRITPEERA